MTTPPTNFLLGERGVDTKDWFSSTGVRQRLARGSGTWNVSWDASRTSVEQSAEQLSAEPAVGAFRSAFSQPLLKDRKMDAARQQNIIATRDQQSSELRFREAGVQTIAAVKQAYWTLKATLANVARSAALARAGACRSSARTKLASISVRLRRSICFRPRPRSRSGAKT